MYFYLVSYFTPLTIVVELPRPELIYSTFLGLFWTPTQSVLLVCTDLFFLFKRHKWHFIRRMAFHSFRFPRIQILLNFPLFTFVISLFFISLRVMSSSFTVNSPATIPRYNFYFSYCISCDFHFFQMAHCVSGLLWTTQLRVL